MKISMLSLGIVFAASATMASTDSCLKLAEQAAITNVKVELKAADENPEDLEVDGFKKTSKIKAIAEMDSNGLIEGVEFHRAVTKILAADKVYLLSTSYMSGSATDMVLVKKAECKVTSQLRIQEE